MTVFTVKFPVAAIRDQVEAESLEVKTRVAALDDEPFYLDSLQELIVNDDSLASRIDFKGFDSPGSLLSQRTGFDAAILDYRLSDQEISGIDVARQLRREGFRGPIVMNSSGQIPAEEIADQSLQPLTFAPKPLNAASIVSLLALARSGSYRTATVSRGQ